MKLKILIYCLLVGITISDNYYDNLMKTTL